ncbi:sugar transferase [Luedemannella flava]|uniref:Sugar transferase n=1 Tax=Luedemannella flava TaxID=349316 RepID=A0ABP4XK96_9ACTN
MAWEDKPEVTTSLRPSTTEGVHRRGRHRARIPESIEIIPNHNGVPRSGLFKAKRASTWHRPYRLGLLVLDYGAAALASFTASGYVKSNAGFDSEALLSLVEYLYLPLAWLVVLWGHGAYDRRYLGVGTDEFKRVFRTFVTMTALVAFVAFSSKAELSRVTVGIAMVSGLVYMLIGRYLARRFLILARGRGRARNRLLLVGTLPEALEVYTAVSRAPGAGMMPIGIRLTEGYVNTRGMATPVPVFVGREVMSLVRELGADTIAVCGSASNEPGELRRLAWQLEGTGIDLVVAPQLTDIAGPRVHIRPVEGLPLLHVEEPTLAGLAWLFKNFMDRLMSALLLAIISPLLLIIAILIKLSDRGPVFFRQSRVGREGKTFRVWKFRTMYTDAEERLAHLVEQNETDGLLFKIRNDPRITPVGRFLRASSLDELPQLINVLRGDMSLVGPRPLPADDGDFLGDVRRRLLVRPGMTGLWQVSGRSELSWDDAVRLDLYYVDNWSLAFDLLILWRTIGVVLARKGAY